MNSIDEVFEKFGLGFSYNSVNEFIGHNSEWTQAFRYEANRILLSGDFENIEVHHVGSTSIQKMGAKPILDLLVIVPSINHFAAKKYALEKLGYEHVADENNPEKICFVLFNHDKTKHFVHLHIYERGHLDIFKMFIFRDSLRENIFLAKEYESLRKFFGGTSPISQALYLESKTSFIKKTINDALSNPKSVDEHYLRPKLVEVYAKSSGWSENKDFYLDLAGKEKIRILDMGCGMGLLANAYSKMGHQVMAADPSPSMLEHGKSRFGTDSISFIRASMQNFSSHRKFDLIVMTDYALQSVLTECDLARGLGVIRKHLADNGTFVFETRNPASNWKDKWDYKKTVQTSVGHVEEVRSFKSFDDKILNSEFEFKFADEVIVTHSHIRFWTCDEIQSALKDAGLFCEVILGGWNGKVFDPVSSDQMIFKVKKESK